LHPKTSHTKRAGKSLDDSPRKRLKQAIKRLPDPDPAALNDLVALLEGKKVRKHFQIYIEPNTISIGCMDGWIDRYLIKCLQIRTCKHLPPGTWCDDGFQVHMTEPIPIANVSTLTVCVCVYVRVSVCICVFLC
jgi:hypothetical protein